MDTVADSVHQVAINIILSGTVLLAGLRYLFDRAITVILAGGVPLLLFLSSLCAIVLAVASIYHVIHLVCYGSSPDLSRFTPSVSLADLSLGHSRSSASRDPEIGVHMVPIWVHGADIDGQGHSLLPLTPPSPSSSRRSAYIHRGGRTTNQGWYPKKFDDSTPRNERFPKEVEMRTVSRTATSIPIIHKSDCHHD